MAPKSYSDTFDTAKAQNARQKTDEPAIRLSLSNRAVPAMVKPTPPSFQDDGANSCITNQGKIALRRKSREAIASDAVRRVMDTLPYPHLPFTVHQYDQRRSLRQAVRHIRAAPFFRTSPGCAGIAHSTDPRTLTMQGARQLGEAALEHESRPATCRPELKLGLLAQSRAHALPNVTQLVSVVAADGGANLGTAPERNTARRPPRGVFELEILNVGHGACCDAGSRSSRSRSTA